MSIEEVNPAELGRVIVEMKSLKIASLEPDITSGEDELKFISIKKGTSRMKHPYNGQLLL